MTKVYPRVMVPAATTYTYLIVVVRWSFHRTLRARYPTSPPPPYYSVCSRNPAHNATDTATHMPLQLHDCVRTCCLRKCNWSVKMTQICQHQKDGSGKKLQGHLLLGKVPLRAPGKLWGRPGCKAAYFMTVTVYLRIWDAAVSRKPAPESTAFQLLGWSMDKPVLTCCLISAGSYETLRITNVSVQKRPLWCELTKWTTCTNHHVSSVCW